MLMFGCKSVLLVEDEPDLLMVLGDLFEEEGLETHRAPSGSAALALLRGGLLPHLILVDLAMPGMSGEQFLKTLRANPDWQQIAVAVMTGHRGGFELIRAMGADDVLEKPFTFERLNDVMRRLCVRHKNTG